MLISTSELPYCWTEKNECSVSSHKQVILMFCGNVYIYILLYVQVVTCRSKVLPTAPKLTLHMLATHRFKLGVVCLQLNDIPSGPKSESSASETRFALIGLLQHGRFEIIKSYIYRHTSVLTLLIFSRYFSKSCKNTTHFT